MSTEIERAGAQVVEAEVVGEEPRSRVFRCVVTMEVFAFVAEGVPVEVARDCLLVPRSEGRKVPSKFDPEAHVRDAIAAEDIGPDIGMMPGESYLTTITELSR